MPMISFRSLLIAVAVLGLPLPAAAAWWNDDWAFRKQILLDLSPAGANIPGSPVDVPVLVRLHAGNFGYFNDAQPDGDDFRFVAADDVTPLKYHIERFDPVNQMVLAWVRVPRLTGGTNSDFVYLYYGNPDAPAGDDRAGTYDANQVVVYHFSEANGIASDTTAYGNQPAQSSAELNVASLIAGGARFDGTTAVRLADSPTTRIVPGQGVTISTWLRMEAAQQDAYVVSSEDSLGRALVFGVAGASPYVRLATDAAVAPVMLTAPQITLGEWHHFAVRAGEGRVGLFIDGVEAASMEAALPEIAGGFSIGQAAAGNNGYVGELDELQISNTVRSADWLKAAATSQGITANLAVYGPDAQRESGGGGESYFATTLRNVTVDGWVVVVMLAVMFAVSVWVIVAKAFLLGRVERENRKFLSAYREIGAGDPLALVTGVKDTGNAGSPSTAAMELGDYQPSTLFPLYAAGVNEVRHRLRSPAVGARASGFTAETMGAIRATVDAVFVRERQKLNARMVLLTIAISGGPFLGLLGTVVGVMVTFAAIAASGDVNVNAIAPGIAAALVATVAGLGVAIPALFAYNWLGSRIKDIDAETHVFGDEFVNKLAEHYA
jgi:biopolymer transport protein ExbB